MLKFSTPFEAMRSGAKVEVPYEAVRPLAPVARGAWPFWAKLIGKSEAPGEVGVGDTVARLVKGATIGGAELVKKLVPCGCARRQQEWNERYPYHA